MDDKEFWYQMRQRRSGLRSELEKAAVGISLDPNYRVGVGQAASSIKKREVDIDAILADVRKITEERARRADATAPKPEAPVALPQAEPDLQLQPNSYPQPDTRPRLTLQTVDKPPGDDADSQEVMQELLSQMRALTEEVRNLRAQIGAPPADPPTAQSESAEREEDPAPEAPPGPKAEATPLAPPEPEVTLTAQAAPAKAAAKPKKSKALSIISSILFYVVVVAMVIGAFLMRSTSEGQPFMLAGFSAANVLTGSMEDVYPRGSLIITKSVEAEELKVGDDITYMVSQNSSITHRIIGITENYQGSGERAFETQGTMNPNPDKEPVAAANVVGKVVFHSKGLGDFANFIKKNWPFLLFLIVVLIALITFLKWNAKKSSAPRTDAVKDPPDPSQKSGDKPKSHAKKRKRKEKK